MEKGNVVQFGPKDGDDFILNVASGKKMQMKKERGSYVLDVDFMVEDFQRQVA